MELKILWMYHDLMDLYGDRGNIQVLKQRSNKRGINCIVDTCGIDEAKDISQYDLFFMGGGADREQGLLYHDLIARKDNILEAMHANTQFFLVCGGYQLFGQYYKDQDGKVLEGLKIFDYYSVAGDRDHRCIGNIAIETTLEDETFYVVGFENHGGQTHNVTRPFGKVIYGHGNTYDSGFEGYMSENVIGTYMHGPLLPKNPKIADALIRRSLTKRYHDVKLSPLDDTLELKAQETMLKRLKVK